MEPRAHDYYDIDADLLPGANFAGRPVSEIFWTSILSSPSSSDEDDGTPIAEWSRELSRSIERTQSSTAVPAQKERPMIIVTSPTSDTRQGSPAGHMGERPNSKAKAQTAPPGYFDTQEFSAVRLRGANSVRMGYSGTMKGGKPQLDMDKRHSSMVGVQTAPAQTSFSEKMRVKKTLEVKQMSMLNIMATGSVSDSALDPRYSFTKTPKDLYAFVHPNTKGSSSTPDSSEKRSTLYEPSQGHSQAGQQGIGEPKRESDVKDACQERPQRVYFPGKIVVEKHPAFLRKDSVASMDTLDPGVDLAGRRRSDMTCLEDIFIFFDEFDVVEAASEACQDRYWLQGQEKPQAKKVTRRPSSVDGTPTSPQRVRSPKESRFSFSSNSSTTSEPSGERTKRPRIRFRNLLSKTPALPGSAFLLENPASHEAETS